MSSFGRKGYKAFEYGMVCRGKQYAENTVFEEPGARACCRRGVMHYCENPLDVLDYYPLIDSEGRITEIAEIEPMAKVLREDNKCATKKIRIGAKLSFKDFVKAGIDFVLEKCKGDNDSDDSAYLASSGNSENLASSRDYTNLVSSGDWVHLASSGYYAHLASSGYYTHLASSGNRSSIVSSGDCAHLSFSGDETKLFSSGDCAQIASSGNCVQIVSSGDYAKIASSAHGGTLTSFGNSAWLVSLGDFKRIASFGKDSVVASIGRNNKAKGALGNWIVLAEWGWIGDEYKPVCVKAEQVDGERIKADTWYELNDGEFVEVK